MSFPDQKTSAMGLSKIVIRGTSISFESPAIPRFEATVASDGNMMKGSIQLARNLRSVELKRVADSKLRVSSYHTPLSNEFEGAWEGNLQYGKT